MKTLVYIVKAVVMFLLMLLVLTGLDYWSASIDRNEIRENTQESLRVLSQEGDYCNRLSPIFFLRQDNFTDAIMLGSLLAERNDMTRFENVCYSPIYKVEDSVPRTMGNYQASMDSDLHSDRIDCYPRYWHGYQLTLRPLMKCMGLRGIRVLNYVLLFGMAITVFLLCGRVLGRGYGLSFLLSFLIVGFPVVPLSLQFVTCFLICLLTMTVALLLPRRGGRDEGYTLWFMIAGGLTSFFDFLTTPLLTLGMPLIVMLLRRDRFPDYRYVIVTSLMWAVGYAGIWSSKWILAGVFTPFDIVSSVTEAISFRSSSALGLSFGLYSVAFSVFMLLGLACMIGLIYVSLRRYGVRAKKCLSLMLVGFYPFLWVLAMQNHSFIHCWFVWRIFAISVFALGAYYIKVMNKA